MIPTVLTVCGIDQFHGLRHVPQRPAVYRIVNNNTGKCYVGSAVNVRKRWQVHIRTMCNGIKAEAPPKLFNSWQKHGDSAFSFHVLLFCPRDKLLALEEDAIRRCDAVVNGYNVRPVPNSNLGLKLGPRNEEQRRRHSRMRTRLMAGKSGPMPSGGTHRAESRRQMSKSKRAIADKIEFGGESLCLSAWAERIGITMRGLSNRLRRGWPLGRALSEPGRPTREDHRSVMRERHGRKLEFNGETVCIAEWAERTGLSPSCIRKRLNRAGWTVERALTTPSQRG